MKKIKRFRQSYLAICISSWELNHWQKIYHRMLKDAVLAHVVTVRNS